jgi:paraquat-inducible protein A
MSRAKSRAGLTIAASSGRDETGTDAAWTACPDCGLGQRVPALAAGSLASCRRCHGTLAVNTGYGLDAVLAVAFAALFLLLFAYLSPLLSVHAFGETRQSWIYSGVEELWRQGFGFLALIVASFSIAAPLAYLGLLAAVLSGLVTGANIAWLGPAFRWAQFLRSWAMPEIYAVGGFVAYSRLQKIANVEVGVGGWAFLAAALAFLIIDAIIDRRAVWRAIGPDTGAHAGEDAITCLDCDLLVPRAGEAQCCPRCGARLHHRKPQAQARTAALVLAASLLYIPANFLPVLTIVRYGRTESDTIMAGIRELANIGAWPLAVIVFLASIVVPLLKLLSLTWFMIAEMSGSPRLLVARSRLHDIVNNIGRWSNIDVFMGSILVGLVQFGVLTNVTAGSGATAFAAVVVLTMIASRCYDPRLMWDAVERKP